MPSPSSNPFRQPFPRRDQAVHFKTWNADPHGKDASSGTNPIAVGDTHAWLSREFSVPLEWITETRAVGPGLLVAWNDRLTGTDEVTFRCVRTFFGYDERRRNAIVAALTAASRKARARAPAATPVPATTAPAAGRRLDSAPAPATAPAASRPRSESGRTATPVTSAQCEVCGAKDASVIDLARFWTAGPFSSYRPLRGVMCARHAAARFRWTAATNLLTSPWGLGLFQAPFVGLANVRSARGARAIGGGEAAAWTAIAFVPWLPIAAMLAWSAWSIATS